MVLFHGSVLIREETLTTSNDPVPNQVLAFALLVLYTYPIDSSTRFTINHVEPLELAICNTTYEYIHCPSNIL